MPAGITRTRALHNMIGTTRLCARTARSKGARHAVQKVDRLFKSCYEGLAHNFRGYLFAQTYRQHQVKIRVFQPTCRTLHAGLRGGPYQIPTTANVWS
jgi:hypothetical protein